MCEDEKLSCLIGDIYDAALHPTLWVDVLAKTRAFIGGFAVFKRHGGEVLEFLGDGILAILHENGGRSAREACKLAFEAARQGLEGLSALHHDLSIAPRHLKAGFALHYGEVSYGNIGAGDRLDFTVIGPDVNLTSRIGSVASSIATSSCPRISCAISTCRCSR